MLDHRTSFPAPRRYVDLGPESSRGSARVESHRRGTWLGGWSPERGPYDGVERVCGCRSSRGDDGFAFGVPFWTQTGGDDDGVELSQGDCKCCLQCGDCLERRVGGCRGHDQSHATGTVDG